MKNRLLYALALLFCHLVFSPAQSADAQITLVGEPAQDVYAVPGEQYAGSVMLHNESDSSVTIRIYQDEITALTSFDRGDRIVTINRSNASWITHGFEKMTIQAGAIAKVEYNVMVPIRLDGNSLSGTYWSALAVDVIALGVSEFRRPYSREQLLDITTHIKDTGNASLSINGMRIVDGPDGSKTLQAVMVNTGDVLVESEVWFELYDTAGNLKERLQGSPSRIYPGGFERPFTDVSRLKPGIYEALVVVDAGNERIFGAQYTLDLSGLGTVAESRRAGSVY